MTDGLGLAGSALAHVRTRGGGPSLALWHDDALWACDFSLDELMRRPVTEIRKRLDDTAGGRQIDPATVELAAPVMSQEVWAAGVTYLRSRDARLEEAIEKTIYDRVYRSDRPELFFKAAGWRVVATGEDVGIRADSTWNVPEPELAVLADARGELVGYACGNDMSSRSIEGENPLFLPQAKIYDRSCAIGPAAVLAWTVDISRAEMRMTIERGAETIFQRSATIADMTREPRDLVRVLYSSYTLPVGAWLLTGTSIVPPETYSARPGDVVRVGIDGLGELVNRVALVPHSGAQAKPVRARAASEHSRSE